jgi:hypothetical protein
MNAPGTPALGEVRADAVHDLMAVLSASDAIERLGFEVRDRVRPVAGSCIRLATRLIRFAGQNAAVRLDEVQRRRAVACVTRASCTTLTAAEIDQCLRSATVREVLQAKPNKKGAAA